MWADILSVWHGIPFQVRNIIRHSAISVLSLSTVLGGYKLATSYFERKAIRRAVRLHHREIVWASQRLAKSGEWIYNNVRGDENEADRLRFMRCARETLPLIDLQVDAILLLAGKGRPTDILVAAQYIYEARERCNAISAYLSSYDREGGEAIRQAILLAGELWRELDKEFTPLDKSLARWF